MEQEEQGPEIIITRSSSKDAGIGWSIRLERELVVDERTDDGTVTKWRRETDEEYLARTLATHRRLEQELLGKVEA